ncbi:MAG: glycosyltransferase family 2 protein [Candidatus Aenigmarchaeota archaeon]|nr:glycosyltransferase family 2 protein [Candidatus Aenigmarchaeota archaeon]
MVLNPVIDITYLVFSALSIFFGFLFFVLYIKQRGSFRNEIGDFSLLPSVSLIIPAYNEEKSIGGTIEAVKNLQYPKGKLEIIVVDDGSKDKTAEIAGKFTGINLIKRTVNGGRKAIPLNQGIRAAKGEIVGCVDADSYPKPDALIKAVQYFRYPGVAAVTSSVFVREPKKLIERLQAIEYMMIVWARKLLELVDGVYVTPGPLSLYKASVLKEIGGFDEKNFTEDIEIAWRILKAGYKIKMSLGSEVESSAPTSFGKWWKQRVRWNLGGIQTSIKYKSVGFSTKYGSLGSFIYPFFVLSYIFSIIGAGVYAYVFLNGVYNNIIVNLFAVSKGISPYWDTSFFFLPNIFSIFGFLTFALSLIWIKISLGVVKRGLGGWKGLIDLALYLTVYITLFPFNLVFSTIKYVRGKGGWW